MERRQNAIHDIRRGEIHALHSRSLIGNDVLMGKRNTFRGRFRTAGEQNHAWIIFVDFVQICVRGPNVFHGYLGSSRSPFITIDGKEWYRTGDLGHLEPDRSLILSGRLKRFIKVGGEMISMGAVEEVILKQLIKKGRITGDLPSIAVCAVEKEEGKTQLILFAIVDLDKEEANQLLQEGGFSNLVKISSVKRIDEIPLMGAGKTDYRTLQALCT